MDHSHKFLVLVLLAAVACGPPRFGSEADDNPDSGEPSSDTTESGTTTVDPSETETGETSTTVDFVPPYDGGGPECDPWSQDCPEGEKCVPYATDGGSWNANKCVPIIGEQAPGEPCTYAGPVAAVDDCDATGACINAQDVGGELIGTCWAFCTGNPEMPECPAAHSCAVSGSGDLAFCIPHCDPLLQDCSGEGQACYWTGVEFECVFTTEDIPAGEPCGFVNDCALGHVCLLAEALPSCEGSSCCTAFCELERGDLGCQSVPGTSCVPFFEERAVPPGYEHVGVCVVP